MKKIKRYLNYIIKINLLLVIIYVANFTISKENTQLDSKANQRVINLSLMAMQLEKEIEQDPYQTIESLEGDLTGYSADCPLCSGKLACMPSYNVLDGTDTYVDSVYGTVNIVASSTKMPCGSILRLESKLSEEPIYAIVLDRGVLNNDLDLLTKSEDYARKYVGRSSVKYDVLRKGWTKDN